MRTQSIFIGRTLQKNKVKKSSQWRCSCIVLFASYLCDQMPLSLYTIESGVSTIAEDPLTVHPNDFLSDVAADDVVSESDFVSSGPRWVAWKSSLVHRADFLEVSRSMLPELVLFPLDRISASSCGGCW